MAKSSRKPSDAGEPIPGTTARKSAKVEIFDCEQNSEEWLALRLGLPTASNFATIMRSGRDGGESKTRTELLYKLAGERLTGVPAENYRNKAMERGNEMEPEARKHYERTHFVELHRVGFVRRGIMGCSPDSLVGDDGALEIKTMAPHLLIAQLVNGAGLPPEHRAQVHGTLLVTERAWVDLLLFYRRMPVAPVFRIERDETYIKQIADEVEKFDYELRKLVERLRAMGKR